MASEKNLNAVFTDIATKDYVDASIGKAITNVLTEEF